MGQVSVTLNGRTYRLSCDNGEEQHLLGLVAHVRSHMDQLVREHGQVGDERLLLMTSLLIADELHDARAITHTPQSATNQPKTDMPAPRLPASEAAAPRLPLRAPGSSRVDVAKAGLEPATGSPTTRREMIEDSQVTAATPVAVPVTPEVIPPAASPVTAAPTVLPGRPPAVTPAVVGTRSIEDMDATALMKGLERKIGRS